LITSLSDAFRSIDLEAGLAFREVGVIEIREVLRAWLAGAGLRRVAEQAGVDRKTARYPGLGITGIMPRPWLCR
jgi:hypothetical protein